jgi:OmpA-OmpF porin, OOP family
MGLKPAIHSSLPASSFKVGSAELPELLKKQLDVFAEVLRGKKGSGSEVRIVGHADASGTPEVNQQLSVKRAEAVKDYLVQKGADPSMLVIVGLGSNDLANPANPTAAENRRVEIGRQAKQ